MATFVQLGAQDTALDLVQGVTRVVLAQQHQAGSSATDAAAKSEAWKGLVKEEKWDELITSTVLECSDMILAAPAADQSSIFAFAFALFSRLSSDDLVTIASRLLPLLVKLPTDAAASLHMHRLSLLVQLFNVLTTVLDVSQVLPSLPVSALNPLPASTLALVSDTLAATLRFAFDHHLASELAHTLPSLLPLVDSWELPIADRLTFLELAYHIATQCQHHKDTNAILYKYLTSFNELPTDAPNAAPLLNAVRPIARRAALSAISSTMSSTTAAVSTASTTTASTTAASLLTPYRLLGTAAVAQLCASASASNDDKLTYELLRIFANDDVSGYAQFHAANGAWMVSQGLDHAALTRKVRVLSLCALVTQKSRSMTGALVATLAYSAIQKHLSLASSAEVEEVVIDALTSGRVDLKIDDQNEMVEFKRVATNVLKPCESGAKNKWGGDAVQPDWAGLAATLQQWRSNVQAVLQALGQSHVHSIDDGMVTGM